MSRYGLRVIVSYKQLPGLSAERERISHLWPSSSYCTIGASNDLLQRVMDLCTYKCCLRPHTYTRIYAPFEAKQEYSPKERCRPFSVVHAYCDVRTLGWWTDETEVLCDGRGRGERIRRARERLVSRPRLLLALWLSRPPKPTQVLTTESALSE